MTSGGPTGLGGIDAELESRVMGDDDSAGGSDHDQRTDAELTSTAARGFRLIPCDPCAGRTSASWASPQAREFPS